MNRAGRAALLRAATARMQAVRLGARPVGLAVMHHRVDARAGDEHTEFVPAVSVAAFDAQLGYLRRHYRLVPASRLLDAVRARRRGQRIPVALTFDDNTACHRTHAAPVLRRHGAPATFFLNDLGFAHPEPYWWQWLQSARDARGSWDGLVPAALLGAGDPAAWEVSLAIEALPAAERAALAAAWREAAGGVPPDQGLRAPDAEALADDGFDLGFHGAHHEPMSLADDATLGAELERGALLAGTTTIAYPHGKADRRVADAARARGFTLGFTVRPEAVTPASDPLLLGRVDGATDDLATFARRLAAALTGGGRG